MIISLKKKCIFILVVFFISIIYAAPNIYGEDPSIILNSHKEINSNFVIKINNDFIKKKIISKSIKIEEKNVLIIRFATTVDQFNAYEIIKKKKLPAVISLNILNSNKLKLFQYINSKPMKMGLDLRGGVHLLIKINTYENIKNITKINFLLLKNYFKKNNIKINIIKSKNNKIIKITFHNINKHDIYYNFIDQNINDFEIYYDKNNVMKFKIKKHIEMEIKKNALEQTIHILTKRINELGISDAIIQQNGINKIIVEIPGIQNISYAKKIIGKTATLNFMLVNKTKNLTNLTKKNVKILYNDDNIPIILKNKPILTGNSIIHATSGFENTFNKPCINITIKKKDAKIFNKITKKNIGNLIAIIYKENIYNNKSIEETKEKIINIAKITTELGDQFQITGLNLQESKDLALLLRSGSLPTSITIIEEKLIGPTLGEINIKNGLISIYISLFTIFIFMFLKYKTLGIIANISLILNLTLLISIMSVIGIIVTLPGLAGIALTIGMSIDGNILIFERIKEELKSNSMKIAIENGFNNALTSIIDSNITTLIIGLILILLASGPIKSFGITLSIGILTSLYSSIFVSKTIIDFINCNNKVLLK